MRPYDSGAGVSFNVQKCPAGKESKSGQAFLLKMDDFENISIYQDWMLSDSATCTKSVGAAILDPEVNPLNPSESSKLWLSITHVEPGFSTVFLCSRRRHQTVQGAQSVPCLAELNLKQKRVTLLDILQPILYPVLNERVLRGFHSLEDHQMFIFEALLLAGFLMVAALVIWSVYLFMGAMAENSFLAIDYGSSKGSMILPSPIETMMQSLKNSFLFVAGCGLFMAHGCLFFEKNDDQTKVGYLLILVFPLIFGAAALLRIFLSAARCRIYFQALKSGTRVTYKVGSWKSYMLLWFWIGAAISMACAARVLWQHDSLNRSGLLQLTLLASPLYYMSSSICQTLAIEARVLKGHCVMALGHEDKADLEVLEESALICAARGDVSGTQSSEFGIRDLAWIGRYTAKDYSGFQKLALQFFHPAMFVALLALVFLTWKHALITFATQPELADLVVHGGNITSEHFFPQKMRYGVVVHIVKPDFTVVTSLDQQDPNTMQLSQRTGNAKYEVLQHTVGDQLEQLVNMNTDQYPPEIKIQVNDIGSSTDYILQAFKFDVVPESVTAEGTTSTGEHFRTCVSWDVLCRHPTIYLPSDLTSLTLNISVLHFILDVPRKTRQESAYTVQFAPNLTCRTLDLKKRGWVAAQQTQAGCYYVSPPSVDTCGKCDHEDIDLFLSSRNLSLEWTFWARADDKADNDAVPIVKSTATSQVSLPLDLPASRQRDILLRMDLAMIFDRFDQFPVLDRSTLYAPRNSEVRLRFGAPDLDDLYSIQASCPGVEVSVRKEKDRFEDSSNQFVVMIRDSKEFVDAAVLTLSVVSEYAECSITSLEASISGLLQIVQLKNVSQNDVLHTRTTSFELDLSAFRDILTRTKSQSVQLLGDTTCSSRFHNVKGRLSIAVWLFSKPLIAVVPEVPDLHLQWHITPCVQLPLCSTVRIATTRDYIPSSSSLLTSLTFLDRSNSSCFVDWIRLASSDFDDMGQQLQLISHCTEPLKIRKACQDHVSVQLNLSSSPSHLVAKFHCDTFLSPKLKYWIYLA